MMQKTLQDYVKVYKNFIPEDVCERAVSDFESAEWEKHKYAYGESEERISYEDDLSVSISDIRDSSFIQSRTWEAIHQYVVLDMVNLHEWFSGWNSHSLVRFNKYTPNTRMKIHCDHIHTLFDGVHKGVPVLTVLGVLNDNYAGGEFMMWGDEKIDLPAGSVIVFPSNFLYPHEVRPVTSGVRYSFVSWAW